MSTGSTLLQHVEGQNISGTPISQRHLLGRRRTYLSNPVIYCRIEQIILEPVCSAPHVRNSEVGVSMAENIVRHRGCRNTRDNLYKYLLPICKIGFINLNALETFDTINNHKQCNGMHSPPASSLLSHWALLFTCLHIE